MLDELRQCYGWGDVIIHSDDAEALTMAIEALERDRWISVEERTPEPTWDRVLVYTDEHQIMTLPACKVGNGYVTHWRPLPEPPKEET